MRREISKQLPLILLLFTGFLLRMGYVLYFPHEPVVLDAAKYDLGAKNILHHGTFSYSSAKPTPTAYTMPGYPLFLAATYKVTGESNFQVVRILQVILNTVGLYFLYLLALLLLNSKAWALVALAVGVFHPPFMAISDVILTEGMFLPLMTLWLYSFVLAAKSEKLLYYAVAGCMLGLVSYFRPSVFLFPAFFFVVLLVKRVMHSGLKKETKELILLRVKQFSLHYGVCLLILSPWIIRNALVFHRFLLFATDSGNPFFLGTFYNYRPEDFGHKMFKPGLNEWEQNERWWREGWNNFRNCLAREPVRYLRWYMDKTYTLWNRPYYLGAQRTYGLSMIINMLHSILIFSIVLSIVSWLIHGKNQLSAIVGWLFIYFTFLHIAFIAIPRYALPFLFFGGIFIADVGRGSLSFVKQRLCSLKPALVFAVFVVIGYLLLNLISNFKGHNYAFSPSFHPILLSKAGGSGFRLAFMLYWVAVIPVFAILRLLKDKKEAVLFVAIGFSVALLFHILPTAIAVAFETPLRDGDVATHIIDIPKWAKGYKDCSLIIICKNSDKRPIDYDFVVLVNGEELYHVPPGANLPASELRIPLSPEVVEENKLLCVEIKSNAQREDENYPLLRGSILTRRGLSLLNGQAEDLSYGRGTQRGAYYIALRLYGKHHLLNVYLWRGSPSKKVRRLLADHERPCADSENNKSH